MKPVAQPVCRIQFGLCKQVDHKLNKLLELDIIEEEPDGAAGWISPLRVVPKGDGDVRVCMENSSQMGLHQVLINEES